ncbi:MAG: prepilin peptidase [Phycisphaeraceae bacterium JB051]
MSDWPWYVLIACYGACVGSFLNVVIYRLPEGKSIVTPPSACPHCGKVLRMWENIPVFAWFFLGGKCARCKTPISFQYPAIEFLTGALFLAVPIIYYHTDWVNAAWAYAGIQNSWPILGVHVMLVAALIAATMIDIRHYIIPLGIPYVIVLLALIVYPVATYIKPDFASVIPLTQSGGVTIALGGLVGLILANVLLRLGVLPYSFADEQEWLEQVQKEHPELFEQQKKSTQVLDENASKEAGEAGDKAMPAAVASDDGHHHTPIDMYLLYPHTRREMGKEALFLLLPLLGMIGGFFLKSHWPEIAGMIWLRVLATVILGYISGGAVIWLTRILGSIAFGKEAMGLGDVHLLAAVGAVLGPMEPIYVFFLAPFFGLLAALISFGVARIYKGQARVIPYGPYLAGATLVVMFARQYFNVLG